MVADALVQDISEAYRDTNFDMEDILGNMDDPGPFQNVFLQECETMNGLLGQMRHTLGELDAGFRGEMTMSQDMEKLMRLRNMGFKDDERNISLLREFNGDIARVLNRLMS